MDGVQLLGGCGFFREVVVPFRSLHAPVPVAQHRERERWAAGYRQGPKRREEKVLNVTAVSNCTVT